ncbi:hypothetical protein AYL99_12037 [Fonsecaea erecta]|uniref:Uncharacterized protein n=1 Tax=Fonsecaea erecta TaxID=1367422 RepID=A0A178Z3I1_9EURO|nr:hypothetical protein AYL99_12037 [Fonsecaea erecta]OAP53753.1 hypothetical protein AYL99_12037 [Fonsecaea erecta]
MKSLRSASKAYGNTSALRSVFEDITRMEYLVEAGYTMVVMGNAIDEFKKNLADINVILRDHQHEREQRRPMTWFVGNTGFQYVDANLNYGRNLRTNTNRLSAWTQIQAPYWAKMRARTKFLYECYIPHPGNDMVDEPGVNIVTGPSNCPILKYAMFYDGGVIVDEDILNGTDIRNYNSMQTIVSLGTLSETPPHSTSHPTTITVEADIGVARKRNKKKPSTPSTHSLVFVRRPSLARRQVVAHLKSTVANPSNGLDIWAAEGRLDVAHQQHHGDDPGNLPDLRRGQEPGDGRYEHVRLGLDEPPEPVLCKCRNLVRILESVSRKVASTAAITNASDNMTMESLPHPSVNMVTIYAVS